MRAFACGLPVPMVSEPLSLDLPRSIVRVEHLTPVGKPPPPREAPTAEERWGPRMADSFGSGTLAG